MKNKNPMAREAPADGAIKESMLFQPMAFEFQLLNSHC